MVGFTNSIGLGLSIVLRIMEAHAGKIEVRNQMPRGTEFVLTFRPAETAVPAQATTN
jgi:signal transduction histidine kinase